MAISVRNSIKRVYNIETEDNALKALTTEILTLNSRERVVLHQDHGVLDGYHTYFEIITPAGTKRIAAYNPMPDYDPLLYNLIKKCVDIYREKHPNARIPALGL